VAAVAGTNFSKVYCNGYLLVTTHQENTWSPQEPPVLKNFLGRSVVKDAGANPDLDGQMAEVRLWAGERAPDEIRANLFNRLTGQEPGLLALWNFADGTARDASSHGRDGTFVGAARVTESVLPTAATLTPWSRLRVQMTDSAGVPLQNVNVRAAVDGVGIASAITDSQGVGPSIWRDARRRWTARRRTPTW
jgi:hypothetical protein